MYWIVLSLVVGAATPTAEEKAAEETLAAAGLRKGLTGFVLAEEAEFARNLRDLETARRKVRDVQREKELAERRIEEKRNLIITYTQQRMALRAKLAMAPSVQAHNAIVHALNELGDRINLLQQSKEVEKAFHEAQARYSQQSEQYVELLLETRKLFEATQARYEQLATNKSLTEAFEAYNRATGRSYKLGPSATFLASGKRLAKLEEGVLSESITLRRGTDNLWHVTVTLNGKHAADMAIDTGASIVCLPWKLAQAAGMAPSATSPPVQLHLADGSVVEGHRVVADTIRLGKFTAEKVECAVMPEKLANAAPLLGMSFFKRFSFKLDTAKGVLSMSQVDASDDPPSKRPR